MTAVALTGGSETLVDAADLDAVNAAGPWRERVCGKQTYAARWLDGRNVSLHSFLTGWPMVDHINGDGLDNRRSNLRPASNSENHANVGLPSDNRSGFKGVSLYRGGRWRAAITVQRRQRHLGYFDTPQEAARAYDVAAVEHFGEFARTNFPTPGAGGTVPNWGVA